MAEQPVLSARLRQEIFLQINQRLYEAGVISQELYQEAQIRIVSGK